MADEEIPGIKDYQARAGQMLKLAEHAPTKELRAAYLELGTYWTRLATHAEKASVKADATRSFPKARQQGAPGTVAQDRGSQSDENKAPQ